jgi:hypothetical protein
MVGGGGPMIGTAAAALASKAKVLGLVTAALVAGGATGGYVAMAHVTPHTFVLQTSASSHDSKPSTEDASQGAHGACVSAVARDHSAVGGPHHNHGGAVSAAAHECPKGNGGEHGKAGQHGKSGEHGKAGQHGKHGESGDGQD